MQIFRAAPVADLLVPTANRLDADKAAEEVAEEVSEEFVQEQGPPAPPPRRREDAMSRPKRLPLSLPLRSVLLMEEEASGSLVLHGFGKSKNVGTEDNDEVAQEHGPPVPRPQLREEVKSRPK